MNVQLKDITVTARDGRVSHLDQVYIRGSHVRFFIVPDMLRYSLSAALLRSPLFVRSEEGRLMKLQECAHVQIEGDERERCWIGERKGDCQSGARPTGSKRWLRRGCEMKKEGRLVP